MRVIAGGYDRHNMKAYSDDEQEAYNIPGVSDISLIWSVRENNPNLHFGLFCNLVLFIFKKEWDETTHSKVERKIEQQSEGAEGSFRSENREVILQAGVSAIQ